MPVVLYCSVLFPVCSKNFSWLLTELKRILFNYSWEYTREPGNQGTMNQGTRFQVQAEPRVLVHEPWTREPGSNASRTQGIAPWTMIQGSRWLLQQLQDDPGTWIGQHSVVQVPGSRQRSTMNREPWTMLLGTRYQDPGTMNHVPGSTGRAPTPPAPPLYVVRLPRAKG